MSTNHVYVFEKRQPSKYMWVAECRSSPESGARAASSCMARLMHSAGSKGQPGVIRVTLPYIRTEIPLLVVFRALGFVADKDILEHNVYDFGDHEMMDLLRPSIEEAEVIQSQQVALDFIGKRGSAVGVSEISASSTPGRFCRRSSSRTSGWTKMARRRRRTTWDTSCTGCCCARWGDATRTIVTSGTSAWISRGR